MPQHGQFEVFAARSSNSRHGIGAVHRITGPEPEEVKHERVDDFIWKGVLLLQQDSDEDVGGPTAFGGDRCLFGGNVT